LIHKLFAQIAFDRAKDANCSREQFVRTFAFTCVNTQAKTTTLMFTRIVRTNSSRQCERP